MWLVLQLSLGRAKVLQFSFNCTSAICIIEPWNYYWFYSWSDACQVHISEKKTSMMPATVNQNKDAQTIVKALIELTFSSAWGMS